MNTIIETCKFVVDNSQHIQINSNKVDEFVDYFQISHVKHWIDDAPFDLQKLDLKARLHFLLVFNAISFSYWGEPKWKIVYHKQELDGAYGMICALAKALENNIPILEPDFLSQITAQDLQSILHGNTQITLFTERLNILRQVGSTLQSKFASDFSNLISQANTDSQVLLNLILENFPSFQDTSIYKGKTIYFQKRAQLLVADIIQACKQSQFAEFQNTDQLTACADYKLPFVLRRLGIFTYSEQLANTIYNRIQIPKDSQQEIELRANTIWVLETIKQKLQNKIPHIKTVNINDHIWMLGQQKLPNDKPYHLTRTTAY